jgi:hypothetical protein
MTPKFLFVNKTGSSDALTRSINSEERFTILSHVQSRRRQKGGGGEKAEPWTRHTSSMKPTSENDSISPPKGESQARNQNKTRYQLEAKNTSASTRLPLIYPANNGADPFNCTIAGSDACGHAMLRYAFSSVAKKIFLAEAFAFPAVHSTARAMRHAHIMDERLKRCVEDEMLMYATLAYGSSCLAWSTGKYEHNKPPEYLIGKALQAVRLRLAARDARQSQDVWLLLSIYSLTITEFWGTIPEIWTKCPARYISVLNSDRRDGLKSCRIHLGALLRIVSDAGGWKMLDPYILESSILADKYMAIHEMSTPVIPLTWDPGPMSKARQDELQIHPESTLPHLGKKLLEATIGQQLATVIEAVVDFARIAHCAWSCANKLISLDENWLFLRHQALVYRLLSLPDSLQGLENCVRITTLIFLLNAAEYHGAYVSARTTLKYLTSALIRARLWEEGLRDGVLFWILCTGAMTTEQSRERDWFQEMLVRFYIPPSFVWSKQTLAEDLGSYLFLVEKQESQLLRLVDRLNARTEEILMHQLEQS